MFFHVKQIVRLLLRFRLFFCLNLSRQHYLSCTKASIQIVSDVSGSRDHLTPDGGHKTEEIRIKIPDALVIEVHIAFCDIKQYVIMLKFCLLQFIFILLSIWVTLSNRLCSS
jgi:hypothetical protein